MDWRDKLDKLTGEAKDAAKKVLEAGKQALDAGIEKAKDMTAETLTNEENFPSQQTLRNHIINSKDKPDIVQKYFRFYDIPPNGNLSRGEYQTSVGVDAATDITTNAYGVAKIVKDLCAPKTKVDMGQVKDVAAESGKDTLGFIAKSAVPLVWREGNEVSLRKVGDAQNQYSAYYDGVKAGKSDAELKPSYNKLKNGVIGILQDVTRKADKGASLSTPQNVLTAENISGAVDNLGGEKTSATSVPAHLAGQASSATAKGVAV